MPFDASTSTFFKKILLVVLFIVNQACKTGLIVFKGKEEFRLAKYFDASSNFPVLTKLLKSNTWANSESFFDFIKSLDLFIAS